MSNSISCIPYILLHVHYAILLSININSFRVVYVECSFDETDAILNTLIADINSNKYGDRKRGNSTELLLLFSDLRVGSIIGSKGSIINKIRKESGCYIKAYMKKLPLSDERIVMCSGDEEKIISAVKSIYGKYILS